MHPNYTLCTVCGKSTGFNWMYTQPGYQTGTTFTVADTTTVTSPASTFSGPFTYSTISYPSVTTTVYPPFLDPVEMCTCAANIAPTKGDLDAVYSERNKCVALLVSMALELGLKAGVGLHEDKEGEEWEEDWRHIAFIDLPSGQVSWHLHDSELVWFEGVPAYTGTYDGHSTAEKYERVLAMCKQPQDKE